MDDSSRNHRSYTAMTCSPELFLIFAGKAEEKKKRKGGGRWWEDQGDVVKTEEKRGQTSGISYTRMERNREEETEGE